MLFVKTLKQKRLNKKLSHKFLNAFRILELLDTQTYRLTFFSTYKILSIFHVFLLKFYRRRENDSTMSTMFFSDKINNQKEWKIEEILSKITRKDIVFYQIKSIDYLNEYMEWIKEKIINFFWNFDKKSMLKRKQNENE